MFKKYLLVAAVSLLTLSSVQATPYTAVGVQNDVDYNSVINGGWSVVYRGDYPDSFSIASVFDTIAKGSNSTLSDCPQAI